MSSDIGKHKGIIILSDLSVEKYNVITVKQEKRSLPVMTVDWTPRQNNNNNRRLKYLNTTETTNVRQGSLPNNHETLYNVRV